MQIRLDQEGRHLTNRTSRKRRGNGEWKVFNANDDARLCPGAGGEGPAGGAGTPTEAPTPALRRAGCRNLAASRGKRAVHRGPQPQGGSVSQRGTGGDSCASEAQRECGLPG